METVHRKGNADDTCLKDVWTWVIQREIQMKPILKIIPMLKAFS